MALPALATFKDCADWAKTVEPYFPQLQELPSKLVDVIQSRQGLVDLYVNTNPLVTGLAISIILGAVFLVVAEANKNYSQVDRCWSLLPTFYIAHFDLWARLTGVPSQRLDTILFASILWSVRLTFNYWRRGGYSVGSEDYRWEIIRSKVPAWAFSLLNATFISFIQSILLFALAAPVYPILLSTQFRPEVNVLDFAYAALQLFLVSIEFIADQQQYDFQTAKYSYRDTARLPKGVTADDLNRGFLTSGLWAYSRHPNFAVEQTVWLALYAWSCVTTDTLLYWAAVGPVSLLALFQGSTGLTERITARKYSEYKEYQRQVGMFMPMGTKPYKSAEPKAEAAPTSELAKKKQK